MCVSPDVSEQQVQVIAAIGMIGLGPAWQTGGVMIVDYVSFSIALRFRHMRVIVRTVTHSVVDQTG